MEKMPSSLDYTLHYKYIPLRVRLPPRGVGPPPSTKRRNQSQKKSCKVIILMALHLKRFRLEEFSTNSLGMGDET
jgi:hypothetical protein